MCFGIETVRTNLRRRFGGLWNAHAAYRLLDDGNTIVPFGSQSEHEALQRAFADLSAVEFKGARKHLQDATGKLTEGDFAGSIRESISAVESVARILVPTGKFGAELEKKVAIHGALKNGIGSFYGYTSDEQGIRHPLLEDPQTKVDEIDALFMMGACAAFVSYLSIRPTKVVC